MEFLGTPSPQGRKEHNMFKLKKILNLIDKGIIETREELELFLNYSDIDENVDSKVLLGMNIKIAYETSRIYIDVTEVQNSEEDVHTQKYLDILEKHLPIKLHNPGNATSSKVYAAKEFIIREIVKDNFKNSFFSPVYYELVMDENGHLFTITGNDNQTLNENVISLCKEDNRSGNEKLETAYFKYLHNNKLEHTDRNFDIHFNEYLESEEFGNYLDAIIERFYEALEE